MLKIQHKNFNKDRFNNTKCFYLFCTITIAIEEKKNEDENVQYIHIIFVIALFSVGMFVGRTTDKHVQ